MRSYDFTTLTRSETLRGPTDDPAVVREAAARLLEGVDTTAGVRLLGVGVSGLADYTQEDLFAQAASVAAEAAPASGDAAPGPERAQEPPEAPQEPRRWLPGLDVRHAEYGPGWVQGSGLGRVTVRFEEPWSTPGRVRTFDVDDPALAPGEPLPLVRDAGERSAEDADDQSAGTPGPSAASSPESPGVSCGDGPGAGSSSP